MRILPAGLAALLVVFVSRVALARAGGGGGFSGGGGGGSGGGDGGELPGWGVGLLCALGLLVVIHESFETRRKRSERARRSRELAMRLRDGSECFDVAAFLSRVERAFQRIQAAWSRQDRAPVRVFLSDGVHERFSLQLREQRDLGYRNVMKDVRVLETAIVDARSQAHFDTVAVRIEALAVDYRVDEASGNEIPDSRRNERFVEIWSFVRSRGASAPDGHGLLEGCCPSCSAPLGRERFWECAACGTRVRGAMHDWVLAEITQQSEWRIRDGDLPPGVKAYHAVDPGFSIQQLEDRASLLFWRRLGADRRADASVLAGAALPAFIDEQRTRLGGEAARRYRGDAAVGSVELVGLLPGEGGFDRAFVEVCWEAALFERREGRPRDTGRRAQTRSLLVLARRAGTTSDLARALHASRCGCCGAPEVDGGASDCAWCGAVIAREEAWLLERFERATSSDARILAHELHSAEGGRERVRALGGAALFGWALRVACADGRLDEREAAGLKRLAKRLGLRPTHVGELLEAARRDELEVEQPASREEARRWIAELARLARVDGRVGESERRVIRELERRTGNGVRGRPTAAE